MQKTDKSMNSLRTCAVSVLAALVFMAAQTMMLYAADDAMPDINKSEECTLTVHLEKDGTNISGAGIEIFRVSDVVTDGGAATFPLLSDYAGSGVNFTGMTASQSTDAASKLLSIAESKGISGISGVTDAAGNALFSNLDPGFYLVRQTTSAGLANNYKKFVPFLTPVPGIVRSDSGNSWKYNATAAPKVAIKDGTGIIPVDPPVTKVVKGNPDNAAEFRFTLKAENATNPMPEGSVNGQKTITIKGSGTKEFGQWEFTEPGTYKYTVSEVNTGERGYKYDTTIYTLTYKVFFKEGNLSVNETVTDQYGNSAEKIVYVNEYSPIRKVITGDNADIIWATAGLIICGIALTILLRRRKRTER